MKKILGGALALVFAGTMASADIDMAGYVPDQHPSQDYARAVQLFNSGDRLRGGCLFYIGQYRFRAYLLARPGLDPSGEPALLGALNEQVGRPINEWLGGDQADWVAAMDCAIAWAETSDDPLTPKAQHAAVHAEVLRGLRGLRDDVAGMDPDVLRAQREANGLSNR